jgi:hypothetical protein
LPVAIKLRPLLSGETRSGRTSSGAWARAAARLERTAFRAIVGSTFVATRLLIGGVDLESFPAGEITGASGRLPTKALRAATGWRP